MNKKIEICIYLFFTGLIFIITHLVFITARIASCSLVCVNIMPSLRSEFQSDSAHSSVEYLKLEICMSIYAGDSCSLICANIWPFLGMV